MALFGLVLSRGNAKDTLMLVDTLFKIYKTGLAKDNTQCSVKAGHFLQQLVEHRKQMDASALFETAFAGMYHRIRRVGESDVLVSGNWSSNLNANSSADANTSTSSAIACDGAYVTHTANWYAAVCVSRSMFLVLKQTWQGLVKVGTGHQGTVQGHVYAHNSQFRTSDTSGSLAFVKDKLYYYASEIVAPASRPKAQPPNQVPQLKVSVLNSTTLKVISLFASSSGLFAHLMLFQEETTVSLTPQGPAASSTVFTAASMASDGRFLYFILRKEKKTEVSKEPGTTESTSSDFVVAEVYDPTVAQNLVFVRSVELSGPVPNEPALASSHKNCTYYTTAHQLGVLIPSTNNAYINRVFTLVDGKYVTDVTVKATKPIGTHHAQIYHIYLTVLQLGLLVATITQTTCYGTTIPFPTRLACGETWALHHTSPLMHKMLPRCDRPGINSMAQTNPLFRNQLPSHQCHQS